LALELNRFALRQKDKNRLPTEHTQLQPSQTNCLVTRQKSGSVMMENAIKKVDVFLVSNTDVVLDYLLSTALPGNPDCASEHFIFLDATLRPYQKRGYQWLWSNSQKGFGSCIADDMGLGKTIQIISLLLHTKNSTQCNLPSLVICPTTLIGN
jgi:SNF2 family DNA or RNA helicase